MKKTANRIDSAVELLLAVLIGLKSELKQWKLMNGEEEIGGSRGIYKRVRKRVGGHSLLGRPRFSSAVGKAECDFGIASILI